MNENQLEKTQNVHKMTENNSKDGGPFNSVPRGPLSHNPRLDGSSLLWKQTAAGFK